MQKPRFTVRRLMIAVGVAAIVLAGIGQYRRWEFKRYYAQEYSIYYVNARHFRSKPPIYREHAEHVSRAEESESCEVCEVRGLTGSGLGWRAEAQLMEDRVKYWEDCAKVIAEALKRRPPCEPILPQFHPRRPPTPGGPPKPG